jgi:copper oxidase (laccase) domain-containing protein
VTRWLKARILEQAEVVIARQWHGKHVSTATDTDATTEDAILSMQSTPRTSNRRAAVKYGHESCRT